MLVLYGVGVALRTDVREAWSEASAMNRGLRERGLPSAYGVEVV
jgi:hypothetical protein